MKSERWQRAVLHVDMDAFYASIEQRDRPELKGRPIAVGGGVPRGVVAAASYEARRFGVRSAMPTAKALKLCSDLVLLAPRFSRYRKTSEKVFDIFRSVTPIVEGLSLDEAFLDVTGSQALYGSPVQIAEHIRATIEKELALTASAGVAVNKFVAKLASDMQKPNGLQVTPRDAAELKAFLAPLPIARMWGVGEKSLPRFERLGLHTFAQLQSAPDELLLKHFGSSGLSMKKLASGLDDREVEPVREAKSIGAEITLDQDQRSIEALSSHLLAQCDRAVARLVGQGLTASQLTVKLRYADFSLKTRARPFPHPVEDTKSVYRLAKEVLAEFPNLSLGIRLIGISLSGLSNARQQRLFEDQESKRAATLERTVQSLRARFGAEGLVRGGTLRDANRQEDS